MVGSGMCTVHTHTIHTVDLHVEIFETFPHATANMNM